MKILLADDNPEVRSALRLLLEQDLLPFVVVEIQDMQDLFEYLREKCPAALLLDWELPGFEDKDSLKVLRSYCPDMKVVAMSSRLEARHVALAAGVDAFISKSEPPERILGTLYEQTSH